MCVGRDKHAVDLKLKELFFISAYRRWSSCGDNRSFQSRCRLNRFRSTADEELVVDVLGRKGMKGEAGIASKVRSLRRVAEDERP
jgi:hypothetical protein